MTAPADLAPQLEATAPAPRAPMPSSHHAAGYCAEHPELELVAPRRVGISWDSRRQAIACPSRDHDVYTRDRCRWCGSNLWPRTVYRGGTSERRAYCSELCRNYAWRARRAAGRVKAARR